MGDAVETIVEMVLVPEVAMVVAKDEVEEDIVDDPVDFIDKLLVAAAVNGSLVMALLVVDFDVLVVSGRREVFVDVEPEFSLTGVIP